MGLKRGAVLLAVAALAAPAGYAQPANMSNIGVYPDAITVSGPGLTPGLGRAEVNLIEVDLVGNAPCYFKEGGIVVSVVDPVRTAERNREFELCAKGIIDPTTCVKDRSSPIDHQVKGSMTSDGQHVTIDLQYVDKHGKVEHRESATGPADDFVSVHDKVIAKLIWDLCPAIKVYNGNFNLHDVTINSEYTTDLAGEVRWELDDSDEAIGERWREYAGSGKADYTIKRLGCGAPATFSRLPVSGRLKVYDDARYEFDVSVDEDGEQTRHCARPDLDKDLKWEESYSPVEATVSSSDHCAVEEFYPQYPKIADLTYARDGSCAQPSPVNQYRDKWSFKAEGLEE